MLRRKNVLTLMLCGFMLAGCGSSETAETVSTAEPEGKETAAASTTVPTAVSEPAVTADPNIDQTVSFGLDAPYTENAGEYLVQVKVESNGQYDQLSMDDYPMYCMYEEDGDSILMEEMYIGNSDSRLVYADRYVNGKKIHTEGAAYPGEYIHETYYADEEGTEYRLSRGGEGYMGIGTLMLAADEQIATSEYDENGRLVKRIKDYADGYTKAAEHSFEYYPNGKLFRDVIRQEGEVVRVHVYYYGTKEEANSMFQEKVIDAGLELMEGSTIKERWYSSYTDDDPDTLTAVKVLVNAMKVRSEPSLSGSEIARIYENFSILTLKDPVEADGYNWVYVDGYDGWMATKEGEYTHTFTLTKGVDSLY